MLQYKQEFGVGFELGFELSDYPSLIDKSWHNDACPSFMFKLNSGLGHADSGFTDGGLDHGGSDHKQNSLVEYLVLWVDYPSKEERENSRASRYSIVTATNLGSLHEPETSLNIGHDEPSVSGSLLPCSKPKRAKC